MKCAGGRVGTFALPSIFSLRAALLPQVATAFKRPFQFFWWRTSEERHNGPSSALDSGTPGARRAVRPQEAFSFSTRPSSTSFLLSSF